MTEILLALLICHAVCDYPLQGDFLARAKSARDGVEGVPWWQAMSAHSLIHGGGVWLVTGVWWLGLCETAAHFLIDHLKCMGVFGYNVDQGLHVLCKMIWVAVLVVAT